MDEMFQAATLVAALLVLFGHLSPALPIWTMKLFCHPLNSTRIITLWIFTIISILFLQMCIKQTVDFLESGWSTLKFPQGEEASSSWFGWNMSASLDSGALGQLY